MQNSRKFLLAKLQKILNSRKNNPKITWINTFHQTMHYFFSFAIFFVTEFGDKTVIRQSLCPQFCHYFVSRNFLPAKVSALKVAYCYQKNCSQSVTIWKWRNKIGVHRKATTHLMRWANHKESVDFRMKWVLKAKLHSVLVRGISRHTTYAPLSPEVINLIAARLLLAPSHTTQAVLSSKLLKALIVSISVSTTIGWSTVAFKLK